MAVPQIISDFIIIACGAAGLAASIFFGKTRLYTLLLEKALVGGQPAVAPTINDYPGVANVDGWTLTQTMQKQAESFGVLVIESTEVSNVISKSPTFHRIETTQGNSYASQTVIITSGTTPKNLTVPGSKRLDRKGVHYCAQCAGPAYKEKIVVVYGNGSIAVQAAIHLLALAKKVIMITTESVLLGDKLNRDSVIRNAKFTHLPDTVVKRIFGQKNVTGLEIKNSKISSIETLSTDAIFAYQGGCPNTKSISAHMDPAGFLKVDNTFQTSIPGLFAAGNVIQPDIPMVIATGQGAQAAMSAIDTLNKN